MSYVCKYLFNEFVGHLVRDADRAGYLGAGRADRSVRHAHRADGLRLGGRAVRAHVRERCVPRSNIVRGRPAPRSEFGALRHRECYCAVAALVLLATAINVLRGAPIARLLVKITAVAVRAVLRRGPRLEDRRSARLLALGGARWRGHGLHHRDVCACRGRGSARAGTGARVTHALATTTTVK